MKLENLQDIQPDMILNKPHILFFLSFCVSHQLKWFVITFIL